MLLALGHYKKMTPVGAALAGARKGRPYGSRNFILWNSLTSLVLVPAPGTQNPTRKPEQHTHHLPDSGVEQTSSSSHHCYP